MAIKIEVKQPPIGLTPQNIFLELQNKQRVQDILDACSRYNKANMNIPQEWIDELSYRHGGVMREAKIEHLAIPAGVVVNLPEELPNYLRNFDYDGKVYSVEYDTDNDCDGCAFKNANCVPVNDRLQVKLGYRCSTTPKPIKFVEKQ